MALKRPKKKGGEKPKKVVPQPKRYVPSDDEHDYENETFGDGEDSDQEVLHSNLGFKSSLNDVLECQITTQAYSCSRTWS